MSELIVVHDACRRCGLDLEPSHRFCSRCGSPAPALDFPSQSTELVYQPRHLREAHLPQTALGPPNQVMVIDHVLSNRLLVVAIVLFAGPIGLPALWFSRGFSQRSKIIGTAAYFLVTVILPLAAIWYFFEFSLRPLVDILSK